MTSETGESNPLGTAVPGEEELLAHMAQKYVKNGDHIVIPDDPVSPEVQKALFEAAFREAHPHRTTQ